MKTNCTHCRDSCGNAPITWNEYSFCCEGCKSVFQILHTNDMCDYYRIDENAGKKAVFDTDYKSRFAFLDIKEIHSKIISFQEGSTSVVSLFIPIIHCSSCIWLLENLARLHSGIIKSEVNFIKKEVTITFNTDKITLRGVAELLTSLHYEPQITLESVGKKKNNADSKKLLYKLGIAGFAFGNSMMFSFPEYIPGSETIDFSYKSFFGFLNLLLSLPVFFYSGSDYLITAYKNIRKGIISIDFPIAIGLIAIFVESNFEILTGRGSGYIDSLCGLVFFLLIGKWYQARTYQSLSFDRDYKSYFPIAVTTKKNGVEMSCQVEELKIGDNILIRNMELIPADSILVSDSANIDYSFVTGESVPVEKFKGDIIYAGGKQIGSAIELEVQAEMQQSRLTQIWNQNYQKSDNTGRTRITKIIDAVSKRFTIIVLIVAFASAAFWFVFDQSKLIHAFSSVLIVACPCALALSLPFTYGNVMRIFGKKGFYMKNNEVVEKLAVIDTVVFDKTGTITQPGAHNIDFVDLKEKTRTNFLLIYSLVSNSTHPLSRAIAEFLKEKYSFESTLPVEKFEEIPGKGIHGKIEGKALKLGSKFFVDGATNADHENTGVYVCIEEVIIGYFIFNTKLREDIDRVLEELKKSRFDLHLVSGDSMKDSAMLNKYFGENAHYFQTPDDKLSYVKSLQEKGRNVLMIGDGLNDSGALLQSDVGITVADDIFQFSPACDGILRAGSFKYLISFLRFGKTSRKILYTSFILSFAYNCVGLYFAVQGMLSPIVAAILMPVSSVSIVAYVTFFSSILLTIKLKKIS